MGREVLFSTELWAQGKVILPCSELKFTFSSLLDSFSGTAQSFIAYHVCLHFGAVPFSLALISLIKNFLPWPF